MSIQDQLTDEKLAKIASAARKWALALDHAGLYPLRHVTVSELAAVNDLMAAFPENERAMDNDGQVDRTES